MHNLYNCVEICIDFVQIYFYFTINHNIIFDIINNYRHYYYKDVTLTYGYKYENIIYYETSRKR